MTNSNYNGKTNFSRPEFQTESLISHYQNDTMNNTFIASPIEVVKIGEPLPNSEEINKALEKGEIYKKGYKEGYKQAIIDGKTNYARQQGEWLDNDREDTYRRCSICNELVEKDNYCGNCGADMRKGEKE